MGMVGIRLTLQCLERGKNHMTAMHAARSQVHSTNMWQRSTSQPPSTTGHETLQLQLCVAIAGDELVHYPRILGA